MPVCTIGTTKCCICNPLNKQWKSPGSVCVSNPWRLPAVCLPSLPLTLWHWCRCLTSQRASGISQLLCTLAQTSSCSATFTPDNRHAQRQTHFRVVNAKHDSIPQAVIIVTTAHWCLQSAPCFSHQELLPRKGWQTRIQSNSFIDIKQGIHKQNQTSNGGKIGKEISFSEFVRTSVFHFVTVQQKNT